MKGPELCRETFFASAKLEFHENFCSVRDLENFCLCLCAPEVWCSSERLPSATSLKKRNFSWKSSVLTSPGQGVPQGSGPEMARRFATQIRAIRANPTPHSRPSDQFGHRETIRENRAIRANLRIDSRKSGHLSSALRSDFRVPQKEVGKRSSITFCSFSGLFRSLFGHFF